MIQPALLTQQFIHQMFENILFRNQLQEFYQSLHEEESFRSFIQNIVKLNIDKSTQQQPINLQQIPKHDDVNTLCKMNSTNSKQQDEEQTYIQIEEIYGEINEQLQKQIDLQINKQLFEVQQTILNRVSIEIEEFKESQDRIIRNLTMSLEKLSETQNDLRQCENKLNYGDISQTKQANILNTRQQSDHGTKIKSICNQRKKLTTDLLQYSRIQNKNPHYIYESEEMELQSMKNLEVSPTSNHKNKEKTGKKNIILGEENNMEEQESSHSSQLLIESKISEISEQSNKWLRQANKWYLHVLSKVEKLEIQVGDVRSDTQQKIQASFSGVWNVLTDVQSKINEFNSKVKR